MPSIIDTSPIPLDHRRERGCTCAWCSWVRIIPRIRIIRDRSGEIIDVVRS